MIDTSLTSSNFYFLLAVFQGFLLGAIIIFQQPNRKPNIFFGLLIFFMSLSLLHMVLEESISGFNAKYPIPFELSMMYGPLAYFHILSIKDPLRTFGKRDLMHFLPSLIFDILFFSGLFTYVHFHLDWAYANLTLVQSMAIIVGLLGSVQLAIYTWLIYRESKDTRLVLRDFREVKNWLSYLITCWLVLIGFLIIALPTALILIEYVDDNSAYIYKPLGSILTGCIFFLGFIYLLKFSGIVQRYVDKISKFRFAEEELAAKKSVVLQALEEEQVYKDQSLTIAKFAGHLGWPINSLSKVINDTLGTNFNDLINQYRVEAFKSFAQAPDSKKYSIVGMGQEVGFSSKASFYRVFKKETGMTPTEFMSSQA